MKTTRRTLIAALGALLLKPLAAFAAWNEQAFGAKTAADALKTLGAPSSSVPQPARANPIGSRTNDPNASMEYTRPSMFPGTIS